MEKELKTLLSGELIGKSVTIDDNIYGKIIDETKNTFKVEIERQAKTFEKKNHMFKFKTKNTTYEINGSVLAVRPEDRLKNKFNKIK